MGLIVSGYHPKGTSIFPMTDHPGIEEALSDFEAKISDLVKGMLEPLLGRWVKTCRFSVVFLMFDYDSFVCLSNSPEIQHRYPKMAIFKRKHLFQSIILGIHVNFRGCKFPDPSHFQILEKMGHGPAECCNVALQDNSREFFQRLEDLEKSFITGLTEGVVEPVLCHGLIWWSDG